MKTILFLLLLISACTAPKHNQCAYSSYDPGENITERVILYTISGDGGKHTSVIYKAVNGDTMAFDYMSKAEMLNEFGPNPKFANTSNCFK